MTGRFIAVVGPSGVGKDSVMHVMAESEARLTLARRVITRAADAGGEAFDEVSVTEFLRRKEAGAFSLSWDAHGLYYAIPASVEEKLNEGCDVLANLSRTALLSAKERFPFFAVINLTAERSVLAKRLKARGRETDAQIAARLDRAIDRLPEGIEAHHFDNSGPLEQTVLSALQQLYPVRAAQ